ncbi:hypothetical protein BDA96_02G087500 [Sorghum bicolor]|uniref:Uncharacterized protein n=2 Tax=Sorghum bicolor TaxID=4558 RepID=A0A921RL11_SORBI|nr:hypothetical protein BDA96_02G087500 [Sorghum bicolor]KXG34738.1 hypothetical protein SORBI_3002G084100 [Sorghum bicolor]
MLVDQRFMTCTLLWCRTGGCRRIIGDLVGAGAGADQILVPLYCHVVGPHVVEMHGCISVLNDDSAQEEEGNQGQAKDGHQLELSFAHACCWRLFILVLARW